MKVVDGATGKLLKTIPLGYGAGHNSIMSPSGRRLYLGSTRHGKIWVIDTATDKIIKTFGPFGRDPSGKKGRVSPYCINGAETLCFANSHSVGFYVGDLVNQKVLHWVQVKEAKGFSHGVGMTPDEKEIWLTNPNDKRLWVYDATVMPPTVIRSIDVCRKSHGWITFSLDGKHAWPDTSEVFNAETKKVIAVLKDTRGRPVASSKFIEVHLDPTGRVVRMGDQFGIGRKTR
jgi:DNA-binding beta-propeller fold protein YncE